MTTSFLRVSNFLSKSEYEKLKKYFIHCDLYFEMRTQKTGAVEEENPIITRKDSYFEFNDTYEEEIVIDVKEIRFIENFLLEGFEDVKRNEILEFETYCYDKGLSTKNLREGHLKQLKRKFSKSREIIEKANYLPEKVKKGLLKALKEINRIISREIGVTYLKIPKKLKIDLPKNQIEALFYLLWKNDKIIDATYADIGSVLDYSFEYMSEDEGFQEVYNSRKEIRDFESGKGIKSPLEKLKSFLTDPDTYQI